MTLETNRDATPPTQDGAAGAAVYTKFVLSIYDPLVIRFENALVWKCPSPLMLDHYNWYVSGNHLDVGVGTGYLLDKCQFPADDPRLTLMDLKPNALQFTAARIRRYRPEVNNRNDNLADLERNLERNFAGYSLHTVGCVAFFVGRA